MVVKNTYKFLMASNILYFQCSVEVRQSIISGCDNYVEHNMKEALKLVRSCEASIENHLQEVRVEQQVRTKMSCNKYISEQEHKRFGANFYV